MTKLQNSIIKWLLVSLLCLLLGFSLGVFKQDMLEDLLRSTKRDLQTQIVEKGELSKKLAVIEANLITDQQTIKGLTEENKNLHEQLNVITNKLYFYERVVAPELQSEGVQVYSFIIDKLKQQDLWHYELVLMQAQKSPRFLTGKFALNFSFIQDEQLNSVSLGELSSDFNGGFKFKYFQTLSGDFQLPTGISVSDVLLTLNVPRSGRYKQQQLELHYDWQTLIGNDPDNLIEDTQPLTDLPIPAVDNN